MQTRHAALIGDDGAYGGTYGLWGVVPTDPSQAAVHILEANRGRRVE